MTTNNANNKSLGNNLIFLSRTLSAAEIISSNATPVEIIPAPGADRAVVTFNAKITLLFNTTPFTGDPTSATIRYPSGGGYSFSASTVTASASTWQGQAMGTSSKINESMQFSCTGTGFFNGDSSLRIEIIYQIVDFV